MDNFPGEVTPIELTALVSFIVGSIVGILSMMWAMNLFSAWQKYYTSKKV